MNDRFKVFGFVALLGFLAGILAQLTWEYVIPWMEIVIPAIFQVRYVVTGFMGALLSLVLISAWAYISGPTER